jgi:hypothetical protein
MTERSTPGESFTTFACTAKTCSRPFKSGMGTDTCRSNRPGRNNAGSSTSGRLVAAIKITPSLVSNPSISTNSWFKVCSRSSWPPPMPANRWRPTASISSTNKRHGAFFRPWSNRSRTRDAPTPTNISTKSEPELEKKGTPASPATALANRRFSGPGRAEKQNALGNFPAQLLEFGRVFQETR